MSKIAWAYIFTVLLTGTAITLAAIAGFDTTTDRIVLFVVLVALGTISQLYEVESGRLSYYPHFVFFFAGAVSLDRFLFILLIALPHLVEWGKESLTRGKHFRDWYIQPFNISTHIIAGLCSRWAYDVVGGGGALEPTFCKISAALLAAGVYVGVNHLIIGQALAVARRVSWKESGVLAPDSLSPDYILSCHGYVVAVLWALNPWLILPALLPLVLLHRALMIPALKRQARIDFKTGLWNAGYFTEQMMKELNRAQRYNRPFALIMADLDLLRNINNSYGHLAGDSVLSGVGKIIRTNIRDFDLAGRFGGEEFAIAMIETGRREAEVLAERLREQVEANEFQVTTQVSPIRATMSLGIACFPGDGSTADELIHAADVAVYHAKLQGRNQVVHIAEVPELIRMAIPFNPDRLSTMIGPAFVSQQEMPQMEAT